MSEQHERGSRKPLVIIATVAVITAILVTYYWSGRSGSSMQMPAALQGVLWPEPKPLPAFELTDHKNKPMTREAFKGKWTFLFFGYTSCPDVCPTTLAIVQQAMEQMKNAADLDAQSQVVFISVDPSRDTPERLSAYVNHFNPEFIGATGTKSAIDGLTRELFVLYEMAETRSADDYDINHTASVLVIDPQARMVGRFSPPHLPNQMVEQFKQLVAYM